MMGTKRIIHVLDHPGDHWANMALCQTACGFQCCDLRVHPFTPVYVCVQQGGHIVQNVRQLFPFATHMGRIL